VRELVRALVTEVYEIDPLNDVRWPQFLEGRCLATLFHSPEWLDALQRTYGYRASVLTTSGPEKRLTNGMVFCRVQSWLTGRRLVSVPFSDHCTPLIDSEAEFGSLLSRLHHLADEGREKYLEIRSIAGCAGMPPDFPGTSSFCLHRLDLRPSLNEIFRAFHGSCIRRKIASAPRKGVTYEDGTSEELLNKFYRLALLTRRRQQIPPQPLSWFRNLIACFGERVKIRLASHEGQPAAGILTIRYKGSMTYKYGGSDLRFHRLGPMQLLMWKAIQEAKENALLEFDMGRTEWSNEGLLTFKDRWGAARSTLLYFRHPPPKPHHLMADVRMRIAKRVFAWAPYSLLSSAGNILYRHIG
jgi:CelD/BcsL family acetyltransferase involved in cellulose biosynthesis